MKSPQDHFDKATELFNAGFYSQAAKKRAADYLNRAYYLIKSQIQHEILEQRKASPEQFEALTDLYYSVPDLHHWKEKHDTLFSGYPLHVEQIKMLIELRGAIKGAEIITVERPEIEVKAELVRKTIAEEMAQRKQQYIENLDLAKLFNGLSVSVNAHYVNHHKGTVYTRYFFYLRGKLTSLNMIMAVAYAFGNDAKQV